MQNLQEPARIAARSQLYEDMVSRHGPLLTGQVLFQCLGFRNAAAFRQARHRGHINVPVFSLPNRKGTFAYTRCVAAWLEQLPISKEAQP